MTTNTIPALDTKEGFLAFLRTHPARLLLTSEPEADGSVYHHYDVPGLPKGVLHGANLKACLAVDGADFVVSNYGPDQKGLLWWTYTPEELGLHPAVCAVLLASGSHSIDLLHLLPAAPGPFPVLGSLFNA